MEPNFYFFSVEDYSFSRVGVVCRVSPILNMKFCMVRDFPQEKKLDYPNPPTNPQNRFEGLTSPIFILCQ